jgi:GT2 family glycosyltransferase
MMMPESSVLQPASAPAGADDQVHMNDPIAPAAVAPVDVSVCIVSWNVKELLRDCLNSLKANAGDLRYETIVVDNLSADGSAEMVREEFPWVTLVDPKANLGFGRANNLAYKHSTGRWVLLLNPDTVVLDRAIERLVKFADAHPEAAAVGGRTLKRDGKTLERSCCWGSPGLWPLFCKAFGLHIIFRNSAVFNREAMDYWQRDSVREVGVITGCFLMIRRPVYEKTGGFDDHFFMYAEETDLCWRMRRDGKLMFCPDAQIIHLVGESAKKATSNRLFHINRALLKLFRKHYGTGYMVVANVLMCVFYLVRVPLMKIATLFGRGGQELKDKTAAYWQTFKEHLKLFRRKNWHLIDEA